MSSKSALNLAIVLHAHQPPGNSDAVVRQVILASYRPVLKALSEQPSIRFSLHISGSLFERLERLDPALIEIIGAMAESGQLELLGGAYHEALLPIIPAVDRLGQLGDLRRHLKKSFGSDVHGAWIAERFWEPCLAADLAVSGYRYTLLDEHGFLQAGFEENQLCRPFLTEDQGFSLGIFPISKVLRYLLPYVDPEQAIRVFEGRSHTHPDSVWVFADDLEKFGAWPGTFTRVHEQGWFKDFLAHLTGADDWLHNVTLHDAWETIPKGGLAYLPAASYPEIMRWSLPPGLRPDHTRQGFPRHFLVRYPEVNLLHKRMLAASQAVHLIPTPPREILDQLWMSQAACPYWYGWFGGAYLPNLRLHAKAAATRAETMAFKKCHRSLNYFTTTDFDYCGHEELIVSTGSQWLLAKPLGGGIPAWEDRRTGFDPLSCMNPWLEEGSAHEGSGEPILPFEDLILDSEMTIENLLHRNLRIIKGFRGDRFDFIPVQDGRRMGVRFEIESILPFSEHERKLGLRKTFLLDEKTRRMEVELSFRNPESRNLEFTYGLRIPLSSVSADSPHPFCLSFPEVGLANLDGMCVGEVCGVTDIRWDSSCNPSSLGEPFTAKLIGTRIQVDRPISAWYSPLLTDILLEGKRTAIFQALILMFVIQLRLGAEETSAFRFQFGDPGRGMR